MHCLAIFVQRMYQFSGLQTQIVQKYLLILQYFPRHGMISTTSTCIVLLLVLDKTHPTLVKFSWKKLVLFMLNIFNRERILQILYKITNWVLNSAPTSSPAQKIDQPQQSGEILEFWYTNWLCTMSSLSLKLFFFTRWYLISFELLVAITGLLICTVVYVYRLLFF